VLTEYLFRLRVAVVIDFEGQVAIVTGAGRGLGRLYALELAGRGAAVVVNDIGSTMHGAGSDAGVADAVVSEIEEAGGRGAASHDSVASPGGGQAIVDLAVATFGRLDVVVSNAGIFHTAPFDELGADDWTRMIDVHLHGAFHLGQPAFRVMKGQGYGRFVFVASSAGLFGQPSSAHYAAAKAGLVGLTNVVAIEGEPHGILANTVLPFGYSRMVWETIGEVEEPTERSGFLAAIAPELVVPIVAYLASRSCTVTHHNYSACAGRFARAFVGLAEGWVAPSGTTPTADDIADNWSAVSDVGSWSIPTSIFDEVAEICERLEIDG
jgi:NAD(P)-dependent dehydrogenase (short-subunit alcohol dehydrogenase family)